ncbi:PREDICTED: uncharacterized protein C16orf52 homolog [Ceratotherium simum simum]|uniref:Uncharacterized protein C16orf52 homolog n=1 Tax=Ceratotherium simum simum TaxID=73337 RepID=A0ABM0I973_CERSS|nr:PREDICTED: uncharacterized protein C16orf52 homolog [Ceratotherium simum simum]
MAPGGQAAQEGLPERKLESVQLPTVWNPRGARSRRTARERGTAGAEETSGAAPRAGPQGALRRRPEVGQPCGHQKASVEPGKWSKANRRCGRQEKRERGRGLSGSGSGAARRAAEETRAEWSGARGGQSRVPGRRGECRARRKARGGSPGAKAGPAGATASLPVSGCLFLAADIFAIASIANPDWINTGESAGALTVGLVRQCQTIHGRDRTCIPPRLPPEWVTTLFFIIMGIISLTVTCGLLVASHWRREATKYARWIAFTGMILFCMAALIFPIGFYINEVGGQPYKLPNNTVVGSSYVLFVLSIFFTIVGLLFAGKVCLPG